MDWSAPSSSAIASGVAAAGAGEGDNFIPPNIVYLMVDDLGWNDLNIGTESSYLDWGTPTIDATFIKKGVTLSNHYMHSFCTPSRGALLTGKYSSSLGMDDGSPLPLSEYTLAQEMKSAGYITSIVGKWGVGQSSKEATPSKRGFDYQYGYYARGLGNFYTKAIHTEIEQDTWNEVGMPNSDEDPVTDFWENGVIIPRDSDDLLSDEDHFMPYLFQKRAEDVIRNHAANHLPPSSASVSAAERERKRKRSVIESIESRLFSLNPLSWIGITEPAVEESDTNFGGEDKGYAPMFLYYPTSLVHGPFHAPSSYVDRCTTDYIGKGSVDWLNYCAMVLMVNEVVANLTCVLRETGMDKNTLFVLASDNGGIDNAGVTGTNYPLKGKKETYLEGGIRTVAALYSEDENIIPATLQGSTYDGLMHVTDWLPTLMSIATNGQWNGSYYQHAPTNITSYKKDPAAALTRMQGSMDFVTAKATGTHTTYESDGVGGWSSTHSTVEADTTFNKIDGFDQWNNILSQAQPTATIAETEATSFARSLSPRTSMLNFLASTGNFSVTTTYSTSAAAATVLINGIVCASAACTFARYTDPLAQESLDMTLAATSATIPSREGHQFKLNRMLDDSYNYNVNSVFVPEENYGGDFECALGFYNADGSAADDSSTSTTSSGTTSLSRVESSMRGAAIALKAKSSSQSSIESIDKSIKTKMTRHHKINGGNNGTAGATVLSTKSTNADTYDNSIKTVFSVSEGAVHKDGWRYLGLLVLAALLAVFSVKLLAYSRRSGKGDGVEETESSENQYQNQKGGERGDKDEAESLLNSNNKSKSSNDAALFGLFLGGEHDTDADPYNAECDWEEEDNSVVSATSYANNRSTRLGLGRGYGTYY